MSVMRRTSITFRLSAMLAVAAALVFSLIGMAMYLSMDWCMRSLLDRSLASQVALIQPYVERLREQPNAWPRVESKLTALSQNDPPVHFWVASPDPEYRYGEASGQVSSLMSAASAGRYDLRMPGQQYPLRAEVIDFTASEQTPPLRMIVAINAEGIHSALGTLLPWVIGISLGGVMLASLLGYLIIRMCLRPLVKLSADVAALSPSRPGARLSKHGLSDELATVVGAFNQMLDRVEEAYRRLQSFNADVAHELRTPLTNLIGQTQVAMTRPRSGDEYVALLESNLEELDRLRFIINDMLFLAGADQGSTAMDLEQISLKAEIGKTLEFLSAVVDDAGVTVCVEGDARLAVEKRLLGRAISNMVHNAVAHCVPGDTIRVSILTGDDGVHVMVQNPGEEIPESVLPRLFERFYRVDASRTNSGDRHGLGLAIVKAVARMHGGVAFARSEKGVNTFGIILPVSPG